MIFDSARRELATLGEPYARASGDRSDPVPEALDRAIAADARCGRRACARGRTSAPHRRPARQAGAARR